MVMTHVTSTVTLLLMCVLCAAARPVWQLQCGPSTANPRRRADITTIETIVRKYEVRYSAVPDVAFAARPPPGAWTPGTGTAAGRTAAAGDRKRKAAAETNVDSDGDNDSDQEQEQEQDADQPDAAVTVSATAAPSGAPAKRILSKPFPDMRGHTGYLTFAVKPVMPTAAAATTAPAAAAAAGADAAARFPDLDSVIHTLLVPLSGVFAHEITCLYLTLTKPYELIDIT